MSEQPMVLDCVHPGGHLDLPSRHTHHCLRPATPEERLAGLSVAEVVEWLIAKAEAGSDSLFYWSPTPEYPTQHHLMFEGVVVALDEG